MIMFMRDKIFKNLYIILIIVLVISYFKLDDLPEREFLVNDLMREPVQATSTLKSAFRFDYRGSGYHVKPLADYELWGLVVSVNNINAWYNFYHDENSVNLKDVCVIWGDNLKSDAYRNVNYKSGEWTCYYSWHGDIGGQFYGNKLSNNHLLSASEEVRETIRTVRVGDQIRVKGALVDYAEEGNTWYRKTSMSRDDTNNSSRSGGACEVFFVDEIDVLERGNVVWNLLNSFSMYSVIVLLFVQLVLFFVDHRAVMLFGRMN